MRIHQLTLTAFGPFPSTHVVDFDELTSDGLFLLSGPTGAGKTSILDAVCFGLYGAVPGDRATAKHLHSDHADPMATPEVCVEFSIGTERYRITRSPQWERPKKRGVGSTRIQAHVVVQRQASEGWVALTNRLDEAGDLITRLLGMNLTQFTQVAMLPQGEFQSFLRSTDEKRHEVLQHLFRTRRFEDVERWLSEHRSELRQQSLERERTVEALVGRLQEASGHDVPAAWDEIDRAEVAASGALTAWLQEIGASTDQALADAQTQAQAATDRHRTCEQQRAKALEWRGFIDRVEQARQTLADLAARDQAIALTEARLEEAARAQSLIPLAEEVERAEQAEQRAVARANAQLAQLTDAGFDADLSAGDLQASAAATQQELTTAEVWAAAEVNLSVQQGELTEVHHRRERMADRMNVIDYEGHHWPTKQAALIAQLAQTRTLGDLCAERESTQRTLQHRLAMARQAAQLRVEVQAATEEIASLNDHARELLDRWHHLREQRLTGIAAELAEQLAVGCACPVCGSTQHPQPAVGSTALTPAAEDDAHKQATDASFEVQVRREDRAVKQAALTAAESDSAGGDVAHWEQALAVAEAELQSSREARARADQLATELQQAETEQAAAAADRAAISARLDETSTQHDRLADQISRTRAQLEQWLSDRATSAAALVEILSEQLDVLTRAGQAVQDRERHGVEVKELHSRFGGHAAGLGFDSVAAVQSAALSNADIEAMSTEVTQHHARRTSSEATLADPAIVAALEGPAQDVVAAEAAVVQAAEEMLASSANLAMLQRRRTRITQVSTQLQAEVDAWCPIHEAHATAKELASFVEGKSPDNRLRMRLSAYVLSERLRQVVDAANERLAAMSSGRYCLVQSDHKGAGQRRGGLGLRISDDWTGTERDPVTLSGGETFMVALSLALGLADTVAHEAGGTPIDTIFVDEGFGSLDPDTLDTVMDTLEQLRGSRRIGLVSHVPELRSRITHQLTVTNTPRGSSFVVRVGTCAFESR